MELNLLKLFDGYVKNYHTLNLTIHHGNHSFTMAEIDYFSRLGSMLGYYPFTEDTCDSTYRPMDLTWWDNLKDDYWQNFILHLERENLFHKDYETLEKLFDDRDYVPDNVIGIMNVRNFERMEELVEEAEKMCSIDNALLIFRTNSAGNDKGYFDEVYAYLFKKNKNIEHKTASISELAGTFFMHYEDVTDES